MNKIIYYMLFLCCPLMVFSQNTIKGVVKNTEGNIITDVLVTVYTREDIISYTFTDDSGAYQLRIKPEAENVEIKFGLLGYKELMIPVINESQEINPVLEASVIELKEVSIKSDMIWQKEDTLVYSVNAFLSVEDRTIGDLIQKLPGIEITSGGGIRYNGEPINKFYIEGLDLLNNKYNIATKNIPVDAVRNVEIIENHQPVHLLRDIIDTGQAAINLKLKNNKMPRPVGTVQLGAGASDDFLWDVNAFALQVNQKRQTIVMYKSNNTGNDIAAELNGQTMSITGLPEIKNGPDLFRSSSFNQPPLEKQRYLFNKSHIATLNNLWKTGENSQLRFNFNYLKDEVNESIQQRNNYYLPDQTSLSIHENRSLNMETNLLDGMLTYTDNNNRFYLNNILKGESRKNIFHENILTGNNLFQKFDLPEYKISNDFQLVKRRGRRLWDISSWIQYYSLPQELIIQNDTVDNEIFQKISSSGFYTRNTGQITYSQGSSRLRLEVNIQGAMDKLEVDLNGFNVKTDSLQNKLKANHLELAFTPTYSYIRKKINLRAEIPVVQYNLFIKNHDNDNTQHQSFLFLNPHLRVSYKWNTLWETSLTYRLINQAGDITDFIDAYWLADYRTIYYKSGILSQSKSQSYTIRSSFRNPLTTLFLNTTVTYRKNRKNLLSRQQITHGEVFRTDIEKNNTADIWFFRIYMGKYISAIKTNLSLSGNYSLTKSEKVQQDILFPATSAVWLVNPKINTQLNNHITFKYDGSIINNRLKIKSSNRTIDNSLYLFSNKLSAFYFYRNKLELNLSMEQVHNQITADQSSSLLFANLGAKYKQKSMEYTLQWNNIFNKREYNYTLYSELDTYNYNYTLRPAMVLATITFRY